MRCGQHDGLNMNLFKLRGFNSELYKMCTDAKWQQEEKYIKMSASNSNPIFLKDRNNVFRIPSLQQTTEKLSIILEKVDLKLYNDILHQGRMYKSTGLA